MYRGPLKLLEEDNNEQIIWWKAMAKHVLEGLTSEKNIYSE